MSTFQSLRAGKRNRLFRRRAMKLPRRISSAARGLRFEPLEDRRVLSDWGFGLTVGNVEGYRDMDVDAAGNMLLAGEFNGSNVDFNPGGTAVTLSTTGGRDGFLARYNADGSLDWVEQVVRGPDDGRIHAVAQGSDGSIYLTGWFRGETTIGSATFTARAYYGDAFLAKYTSDGIFQWAKQWAPATALNGGHVGGNDIAVDGAGNVYVSGEIGGPAMFDNFQLSLVTYSSEAFVVKTNSAGTVQWAWQTKGGARGDSRILATDDAVYVGGTFNAYGGTTSFGNVALSQLGEGDAYLAKLSTANAAVSWARRMGGTSSDSLNDIVLGPSGTMYFTGNFSGTADFGGFTLTSSSSSSYAVEMNTAGEIAWAGLWASDCAGRPGIDVAPSGDIYLSGAFNSTTDVDPGPAEVLLTTNVRQTGLLVQLGASHQFKQAWEFTPDAGCAVHVYSVDAQETTQADGTTLRNIRLGGRVKGTAEFPTGLIQSAVPTTPDVFVLNFNPDAAPPVVNQAPVAVADSYSCRQYYSLTVPAGQGVLVNDTDANLDRLTAVLVAGPSQGTLSLAPDGSFSYTPNYGYTGADSFTYTAYDGTAYSNTVTASISVNPLPASVTYASLDAPKNLPDRSAISSSLYITDPYTIADINVQLSIDHARDEDLDVFLVAPDGTKVELFTDVGGKGVNFRNTTLDDEAGLSITQGKAPFTGTYRPERSLTSFDGKPVAGRWLLEVYDDASNKTGRLLNWSLVVTPRVPSAPASLAAATDAALAAGDGYSATAQAADWLAANQAKKSSQRTSSTPQTMSADQLLLAGAV